MYPGVNLHTYGLLIFKKEAKLFKGKEEASSTNVSGVTCVHVKECKIDRYLSLCTKLKSKWTKTQPE